MRNISVILNNIRSSENVGSIIRTSDATKVAKIFLCGITPAPVDRFGRENTKVLKSALGAEKFVRWERFESLKSALLEAKKDNYKIIGVEQSKKSVNYKNVSDFVSPNDDLAFVFGNEVEGLSKEDLELCDFVIDIPMKGKKESLNVAVAVGVVLYEFNQ